MQISSTLSIKSGGLPTRKQRLAKLRNDINASRRYVLGKFRADILFRGGRKLSSRQLRRLNETELKAIYAAYQALRRALTS